MGASLAKFVDACAIVSIMTDEETAPAYEAALARAETAFASAPAAWEAIMVLSRPDQLDCRYSDSETVVTEWLEARGIELRDVGTLRNVFAYAAAVAEKHGIGKRALSNFDCFHYALTRVAQVPLLTLDQRLRQTDVVTVP
jgi:ribonuclease VapC